MIDLSFLSEEEKETILAVLKRDAKLKKAEEQRVQNLKKTLTDKSHLRYLTGEWFYETKQLRHQDRIHGSDFIRASIRHTSKPLSNLTNQVLVPSLPAGINWEPRGHPDHERSNSLGMQQGKSSLWSPSKQRKNPFNSELNTPDTCEEKEFEGASKTSQHDLCQNEEHDVRSFAALSSSPKQDLVFEEDRHSVAADWPHEQNVLQLSPVTFVKFNLEKKLARSSLGFSSKPQQVLLIGNDVEKTDEIPCPKQDLMVTTQLNNTVNTLTVQIESTHCNANQVSAVKEQSDISKMQECTTVQLTTETKQKDNEDIHQDTLKEKHVESVERKNNAFMKQCVNEDLTKIRVGVPYIHQNVQTCYDVESNKNDLLQHRQLMNTKSATSVQEELSSLKSESDFRGDLFMEDGTHRTDIMLISEDANDFPNSLELESQTFCNECTVKPLEDRPSNLGGFKQLCDNGLNEDEGDIIISFETVLTKSLNTTETSEEEAKNPQTVMVSFSKPDCMDLFSPETDRSQLKCFGDVGNDLQSTHPEGNPEPQERTNSDHNYQAPKSKIQGYEITRSPTKTCHPKVLPRESSSSNVTSPFKTFPIDINTQTKVDENKSVRPMPRQSKSPLHETQQTDTKPPEITCSPLQLAKYGCKAPRGEMPFNNSDHLEDVPCLARSVIPQDYQHYLGPSERAHVPPFQFDDAAQGSHVSDVEYQDNTKEDQIRSRLWNIQSKDEKGSQQTSPMVRSLTWTGSGSSAHSIPSYLKPLSTRYKSSTKSLEDTNRSQTNASSIKPNLITTKRIQTTVSVPDLQSDEVDNDSPFETSFGSRRNTGSSMSNISLASLSSVSDSTTSICSVDCSAVEAQGSIQYAVNYIQTCEELQIFVVLCRDLAAADTKRHRCDPYVKCYLLPDKTMLGKRKTSVKKRTVNPNFNEILKFNIKLEILKTQTLNISVWHNDTFRRNISLGEVDLDMSQWDLSNTQINEYALKARVSGQTSTLFPLSLPDSRGLMRVALRFLPQASHSMRTGEVQIWVKDCKNLPSVRGLTIDPFVKWWAIINCWGLMEHCTS
ncbi:synaptotagmin-like protein 2 isoform X2 [Vanacampus margaritifer]